MKKLLLTLLITPIIISCSNDSKKEKQPELVVGDTCYITTSLYTADNIDNYSIVDKLINTTGVEASVDLHNMMHDGKAFYIASFENREYIISKFESDTAYTSHIDSWGNNRQILIPRSKLVKSDGSRALSVEFSKTSTYVDSLRNEYKSNSIVEILPKGIKLGMTKDQYNSTFKKLLNNNDIYQFSGDGKMMAYNLSVEDYSLDLVIYPTFENNELSELKCLCFDLIQEESLSSLISKFLSKEYTQPIKHALKQLYFKKGVEVEVFNGYYDNGVYGTDLTLIMNFKRINKIH